MKLNVPKNAKRHLQIYVFINGQLSQLHYPVNEEDTAFSRTNIHLELPLNVTDLQISSALGNINLIS